MNHILIDSFSLFKKTDDRLQAEFGGSSEYRFLGFDTKRTGKRQLDYIGSTQQSKRHGKQDIYISWK